MLVMAKKLCKRKPRRRLKSNKLKRKSKTLSLNFTPLRRNKAYSNNLKKRKSKTLSFNFTSLRMNKASSYNLKSSHRIKSTTRS